MAEKARHGGQVAFAMRLHLLEHDSYDFSQTNITFWARRRGHELHQTFLCNQEKLPDADSFDWLLVMGGTQHVWEVEKYPWLAEEKHFVRKMVNQGKPAVGICFGAQLLAETLGGEVFPNSHKEIGWHEIRLTAEGRSSFLFRNIPERFQSFHWHSDHFSLPPGCTTLARSNPTPHQAFVCGDRPVVGLQFHPEYTREMVRCFSREEGDEWVPDLFVSGKEKVLQETDLMRDTYWLLEALLDNVESRMKSVWSVDASFWNPETAQNG